MISGDLRHARVSVYIALTIRFSVFPIWNFVISVLPTKSYQLFMRQCNNVFGCKFESAYSHSLVSSYRADALYRGFKKIAYFVREFHKSSELIDLITLSILFAMSFRYNRAITNYLLHRFGSFELSRLEIMNIVRSLLVTAAIAFGAQFFPVAVYSAESTVDAALPGSAVSEKSSEEAFASESAHQVLEATTKRLMSVITEAQTYFMNDPDRFYGEIELILDEVVDFDSFARGVMGKYASKKVYMKLASEEEKEAFKGRMNRFSDIFRDELVKTYAKGLLAFNGNRIDVLPPEENQSAANSSVTVIQHIYGEAEKPYVVRYKMKQDKKGQWKLRNLTIEAINLGKIYRSQFYSAAKLYNDDIDRVIDSWSVDPGA